MSFKHGTPAFPVIYEHADSTSEQPGMELRDYMAARALPPVMYLCVNDTLENEETRADLYARKAYEIADAMLKARQS